MPITTKELMLIEDNVKSQQNSIKFMQVCSDNTQDPQVKSLCDQLAKEHQRNLTTLAKHITQQGLQ